MIKKFSSKLLLIISFLICIYVFYKSEIYWKGSKKNYYEIYYYLSSSFLILSVLIYKFKLFKNHYFIIFFSSFIFFLYISELYFAYYYPKVLINHKSKIYFNNQKTLFDKRTKIQIYNDLSKNDKNITITVAPTNFIKNNNNSILPLAGLSNKNTIFCNENGYYAIYDSDRYGFNNPDQEWNHKEIDYLLIGDSFVHGACVNRPNDLTSQIKLLTNKHAINLGYAGSSSLSQLATFVEYKIKTKNVLWFFFENDLEELSYELKNSILIEYKKNEEFSQGLKHKQVSINSLIANQININSMHTVQINSILKLNRTRNFLSDIFGRENLDLFLIQDFKEIILRAKKIANQNDGNFYFIYLDSYKNNPKLKEAIRSAINEMGILFIDISYETKKRNINFVDFFPFKLEGHYNEFGYKTISEIITEKVN